MHRCGKEGDDERSYPTPPPSSGLATGDGVPPPPPLPAFRPPDGRQAPRKRMAEEEAAADHRVALQKRVRIEAAWETLRNVEAMQSMEQNNDRNGIMLEMMELLDSLKRAVLDMAERKVAWEDFKRTCSVLEEERRKVMRRGDALEEHNRECVEVLTHQKRKLLEDYCVAHQAEAVLRYEWVAAKREE
jgi:hypothetical protein